jgi:hypothetical protein
LPVEINDISARVRAWDNQHQDSETEERTCG